MKIGNLLGKAAVWAWKAILRPGLEQRGAEIVADAIAKRLSRERPVPHTEEEKLS